MTETITIDDQDYEVLTLDRIGEITHAKLAGGKATTAQDRLNAIRVFIPNGSGEYHCWSPGELEDFGIQPLKLIERVPVEVIGKFTGVEVYAVAGYEVAQFMVPLGTGKLIGRKMDMKLTQITEEA